MWVVHQDPGEQTKEILQKEEESEF